MHLRTHTHTDRLSQVCEECLGELVSLVYNNMGATDATIPNNLTWFNSKSQDSACKLARALRERERERVSTKRAQRERERTRNAGYLLLSALITKLASVSLALSLVSLSLRGTLSVLFASSRQIVLASTLIRLHQSAFKRDGVHLVEPIGAVYNSRVCVCKWVSAKWFLPFKLTTINILSNELVSVLHHHTSHHPLIPQLGNE